MKEFLLTPTGFLLCYLLLINIAAFFTFGWDKWRAKTDKWRVPEKNLFLTALTGGSVGALLGMRVFRHKTLHRSFRVGIPAILIAQLVLAGGLYVFFNYIRV